MIRALKFAIPISLALWALIIFGISQAFGEDLILKAPNIASMMAQLKSIERKLTRVDEQDVDQFSMATHQHALHVFSPLVVIPGVYDEDGNEIIPPVLDTSAFAILRDLSDELGVLLRALPGNPNLVLEPGSEKYLQAQRYRNWF